MSEVKERPTTTVVTNENKADFVAEKLGWNKEPAEAVVEQTPTEPQATDSEPAPAADESKTAEDSERKPNPKIERRFSEITKQREAAKQEAERERQARIELENRLKDMEAKLAPPKAVEPDPKPKPEQFSDMFEYAEALSEWKTDQKFKEVKEQEALQKLEQERAQVMELSLIHI